jgi:hypothetical protein
MMGVQDIKDLIKDVLHNKDFHPDGVDDNMHETLYIYYMYYIILLDLVYDIILLEYISYSISYSI